MLPGFGEGDDFRRGGVQVREKAEAGFFDPDHGAETLGCGGERPFGAGRACRYGRSGGIPLRQCVCDLLLFYHGEKQEGHGGPQESERMLIAGELTEQIIGLAIEVHRNTGRGLLESAYEQCLCHEVRQAGIACECQVLVPVMYNTGRQKP